MDEFRIVRELDPVDPPPVTTLEEDVFHYLDKQTVSKIRAGPNPSDNQVRRQSSFWPDPEINSDLDEEQSMR
jgi:hypothetical protein